MSIMRLVVETTSVILHHVTHSSNHFIMKRDVCGGAGQRAEKEKQSVHKNSLTDTCKQVSVTLRSVRPDCGKLTFVFII